LANGISLQDIYLARKKIDKMIRRTHLIGCQLPKDRPDISTRLKLENQQVTGAYKIRGAANKLLNLTPAEKKRGIITVSSGNHGRAVAYVSKHLGIDATVCIPEVTPENKVEATRHLGAEVILHGQNYDETAEYAQALQEERGLTYISPYDDPFIIAGAGTIGLELLEDFPQLDTVVVPLSGGGCISGIALALKSANSEIRVVAASAKRAAAMHHSLETGKPIEVNEEETIAEALSGGITSENQYTFSMCQELVDESVLVSDDEIAEAILFALRKNHLVVEGGGAVGIAALLYEKVSHLGDNVAVVVTGGNIDLSLLLSIAQKSSFN